MRPAFRKLAAMLMLAGCAPSTTTNHPAALAALKDAFRNDFMVGAALNQNQFEERDTRGVGIVKAQFNTVSPENALKWEVVHPQPGVYAFELGDRYVRFGTDNGMFVIGHTLVWHSQTPRWVFEDASGKPLGRDALLERMRDHIYTVVGRYRGRIKGWDVVNEALEEDGTLRKSPWLNIIGEDYLAKAFQYAHEADPSAELYYNDYSMENPAKRAGGVALIRKLLAAGAPVNAVGLQGHQKMDWPSAAQEDSTISAFAALGVKVNITELDVDALPRAVRSAGADVSANAAPSTALNPYSAGLPDSMQQALAVRYADLFRVFVKHREAIDRVTFWGVADGDSWLNGWPVRGRTSYPLLFDRNGLPKPAFNAVVGVAAKTSGSN